MKKHRYRTVVVAKVEVKPFQSIQEVAGELNLRIGKEFDGCKLKLAVIFRERIHYNQRKNK